MDEPCRKIRSLACLPYSCVAYLTQVPYLHGYRVTDYWYLQFRYAWTLSQEIRRVTPLNSNTNMLTLF